MSRRMFPGLVAASAALAAGGCGGTETDTVSDSASGPTASFDEAAVLARSAEVAGQFQAELQAKLKEALAAGGPILALDVCHSAAPMIAAELSQESGADLSRVSARNRNPDGGLTEELLPHYALLQEMPLTDGKPSREIWRSGEGEAARINVLSAIPMQEQPCSVCHGTDVAPEVAAKINELYPGDKAIGFEPGELRGAMLISWPADEVGG
ncbi:cytochrome c553 [Altererythrobacter atlanticus]|uniref:Tll0287-like domain-containing protein n=1 Tax=Croceibacterium atlanticum TaxID=1267766 RepID=A0A0F7KUN0_9SPHN|nr:DUF3365 domain-containing protein [Croceibacterium atlanticum]AKH44058.1 hypothetical protein WYH_03038 [Croceibacterium atlanticum]MBB5732366.1 cytochrome c553 [Croceibacterium atlanticum]